MTTHAVGRQAPGAVRVWHGISVHWAWLAGGLMYAFAVPYVLADVLEIDRDLFYGLYALAVIAPVRALVAIHGLRPGRGRQAALARRARARASRWPPSWSPWFFEQRTRRPTRRDRAGRRGRLARDPVRRHGRAASLRVPDPRRLRGVRRYRLHRSLSGKVAIGAIALVASLAMTAVYHAGYSDFRSEKMRKPLTGDVIWSVPTLVTLNPIGVADRSRRTAHVGRAAQLRDRHVPAATQVTPPVERWPARGAPGGPSTLPEFKRHSRTLGQLAGASLEDLSRPGTTTPCRE